MGDIAAIITAAVAFLALIGGYVQFVLRRALLPCLEFDVEFLTLSRSTTSDESIGEVLLRIKNEGPAVGYVTNVRCRVRYRLAGESGVVAEGSSQGQPGEPDFAHRLPAKDFFYFDQKNQESQESQKRFIQPGVTQWYRKPLVFPANTCLISVWGRFEYVLHAGKITEFLADLLREPHEKNPIPYVVRHTFTLRDDAT
jgi:hypothetical protein